MTNFIFTRLFPEILNMSLTGSIVILAVLVIRFFLRKAPKKWSYLLWLVVAFRLSCPVSLPSPVSLLGAVHAPVTTQGTIEYIPQNIVSHQTPVISPVTPSPAPSTPNAVTPDVTTPAPQLPVAPEPVSVTDILPVIWLTGMAVVLIYSVVSYLRLRRRLSGAILYDGDVWQSDKVHSPFILGLFRPRIYIPFGLDEQTLRYVLAHEYCHLKRKDHIVKPLAFLLLTLHWFNPLCWLAFHLMGRDMEMSCDEQVLAQENGDRKVYSTALLSFAANRRFPAPSPLAFGEGEVRPRITNALNWKAPKVWVTAAAGVLCVVVLLLCALNPLSNRHPQPFGFYYRASELTYVGPEAFLVPSYENLQIHLSEERELTITGDGLTLRADLSEKTKLTPEEFDTMFTGEYGYWAENRSAAQLRKNNRTAWVFFDHSSGLSRMTSALLLQQEDGSLYLVLDYMDDPLTFQYHSLYRWVLKLERSSVVSVSLSSGQGITFIEPRRYPDGQFNSDYDAVPSGIVYGPFNLSIHTQTPGQTIAVGEDYYQHSGSHTTIFQETYTLTANSAGVCNQKIEPRNPTPEGDYAIYYLVVNGEKYVLRVNFANPAAAERYSSMDEYLSTLLSDRQQVSLPAADGGSLIAPITGHKVIHLEKCGQLSGLASEGTLEVWQYQYVLDLDVDPDRVSFVGGDGMTEDGWFSLDDLHNVVALLDANGDYTVLYDEPNNDGVDFWGGRTPEEAIHDWYVKAYNLTDTHPLYITEWTDLTLGFGSTLPVRRYDMNDFCYIYFPENTWLSHHRDSWRSAYGTGAGFSVMDSMDDLASTLRLAQAEGWTVTNEDRCYRIDRENNSSFVYPQLDGERVMIVYVHWPDAPSENIYHPSPEQEKEELFKIARSFAYYNVASTSPETLRTAAEQAAADWLWDLNATDTVIGVTVHRAEYDKEMTRNVMRASETEDTYACVRVEYSVCCDDAHPVAFSFSHPFPDGSGRYTGLMSLTRDNASEPWLHSSMPSVETLELFRSVPPTEGEWTRMRGSTPEEAVQATLEQQGQKSHVSSLTVDSIQPDQTLTYENIKGLKRSELAQLMGWDERYLDTNYAAVMARYTVRYKEPWNAKDGTYQILFHLLRDESSGTWILMEPLSTRGITIQDNPELEQALTAMIQDRYAPETPDGLYHTQSYTVVDTLDYKRTGNDWTGWYRHLYTVVLNQSYDLSGATPRLVSESHSMDMITVTYTEADHYQLVSYRTPTQAEFDSDPFDTSTFVSDKGVSAAGNLSQYYPEQSQLCYEKALSYKNSLS